MRASQPFLPESEMQFVQINSVGRLLVIPVHLEVESDAVPSGRSRGVGIVLVDVMSDAVQSDRLVQQIVVRGALHLDGQMIPGVVYRVAGDAAADPLVVSVVPDIPLMAAGDAALVSPNEAPRLKECADVKFQNLGQRQVTGKEVNVVDEVLEARNHG